MIRAIIVEDDTESLNQISSLVNNSKEINFLGGFSDFEKIKNIDFKNIELIIFNIKTSNSDEIINYIKNIKNTNPKIRFIALSSEINPELINKLNEAGSEEFILKPVLESVFQNCINKITKKDTNKQANTITIFSTKNATGKTSATINIAYDLAQITNKKICILDLNTNCSDVCDYVGLSNKYSFKSVLDKIENSDNNSLLNMIAQYKDTNFYVLSAFEGINISCNYSENDIIKVLNGIKNIFDYIFVDMSSTVTEKTISILNNIDIVILLGLFDLKQIKNIQQCYELLEKIGYNKHRIKLMINRIIQNPDDIIKEIENTLNKKIDFKIPNNYLTIIDALNRTSFTEETNPQSNIAKAYKQIATEISKTDFEKFNKNEMSDNGMFDLLGRMGE